MKRTLILIALVATSLCWGQKEPYTIGILTDVRTPKLDSLLILLQHQIIDIVGEDALIRFSEKYTLNNNYDLALAELNYQQLVAGEVDLILAFGGINHEYISTLSVHRKPTVLFGALSKEVLGMDFPKGKTGIHNFYSLMQSESYAQDLRRFQELTSFQNVGIIVERPLNEALDLESAFQAILEPMDASFTMLPFVKAEDIFPGLTQVDAVYLIGGYSFERKTVERLAQEFIEKGIPSMTVNGIGQVRDGIMAARQPKNGIELLFRRLALSIEQYINGTPLSELPVLLDYESRLTLNFNTAEAVGVPIKMSLVNNTDFVGGLDSLPAEVNYGLIDIIGEVLQKNLGVKTAGKDVELAAQETRLSKSQYLPSLSGGATATYVDPDIAQASFGQNPEFQAIGTITFEQAVFSGTANADITIQKKLQQVQVENLSVAELNAVLDVATEYFNTLIAKANLKLQLENLEVTRENYRIASQNFEEGENGRSDMLRFQSEIAQNTQQMVEASNQLDEQFYRLNNLLNNPLQKKIDIEGVTMDDDVFRVYDYDAFIDFLDNPQTREAFVNFLIREAKTNAPELKSLLYTVEVAERTAKLNGSGRFLPMISLRAQYGSFLKRSGEGSTGLDGVAFPQNNYSVGVNMSIPLFDGNRNNIRRQRALIEKERLQVLEADTELNLETNVRTSVLNLVNQISNIELSKVSEKAAREALDLTQVAYANGAATSIQLIDAQNNLLNAQLQRATAVYTYLISALRLERFMGYFFLLHTEKENTDFQQRFLEFLNNNG